MDHGVERLPLSIDRNELKSVTRKPSHYIPWGGDAGGDFYRPPRAAVTQGPTAYDVAMDSMPKANLVELHFNNYMKSGEMSRLPHWVRSHYTADTTQPMAKQDRRASAFREVPRMKKTSFILVHSKDAYILFLARQSNSE